MLMNSRRRMILVTTYEEDRFQQDMKSLIELKSYQGYYWTITAGLVDLITGEQAEKMFDPVLILDRIQNSTEQAVYILKDFHDLWSNPQVKRKFRDVLELPDKVYKPIIVTAPNSYNIPMELEKLVTVVKYELPTREQVIEQLEAMENYLRMRELPVPEGREREALIHSLVGMTEMEITNVLKKSVAKNKRIVLSEIVAEKEQVIRKTGLLEYITKLGDMDQVGGMDIVKDWFRDAYYSFDPEARNYNVDPVRGCIMVGFPGTGKSLAARSVAHMWNLPLLKMNMGSIMDSRVGQSEKNIDRALKLAEDVSPCVLWIDEMEKGLAGMGSSDRSDSGTLSRVVQSILTWLSEKTAPVFVIATANDVTKLPPELTRAGRFDEVFFVSLPHLDERKEILKIHLIKRGYQVGDTAEPGVFDEETIDKLAKEMEDFSGAEIESVVSEAGRRAYASFRKGERPSHHILIEDIREQIQKTVPLAKRNPQLLSDLREWAKTSAKCASSHEHRLLHGEYKGGSKPRLRVIDLGDLDIAD